MMGVDAPMTVQDLAPASLARPYPAPAAPRSPYHLTPEQVRFYDDNGYLVLRNWLPPKMMQRLIAAGDEWIERGLKATQADDPLYEDFAWKRGPQGPIFFGVNYIHNLGNPASLELLGSPQVLAVV